MSRWKGDQKNPAPNDLQESIDRSEKIIGEDRSQQVRRDTDSQKDISITLYDIDEAMMTQLTNLQFQVEDAGKQIKVPVFFGSPERWVSAKRDGYLRDKQGKILLPAIILKRSDSADDESFRHFNRYLDTSAIKLYSEKNKYTKFTMLTGQNIPTYEVYNLVFPSHMVLTYHFIIWTESAEQMNSIVEKFRFNTNDYWGSKKGFRFRNRVESFGHVIELEADQDRLVKTEFDMTVHGYILPNTITKLDNTRTTSNKMFTYKKVVLGIETVESTFNLDSFNKNNEKWRNTQYPNLNKSEIIPSAQVTGNTNLITNAGAAGIKVDNSPEFLRIVPVPTTSINRGQNGDMSYDSQYFYFYSNGWKRAAISEFVPVCTDQSPLTGTEGQTIIGDNFLYIYSNGMWRKASISNANFSLQGHEGDIMYDQLFLYIFNNGIWKKLSISAF